MPTIKEAILAIQAQRQIPDNDLKERRCQLKLSRVALARILDVDPATIYRWERGVISELADYALRGVEAKGPVREPQPSRHNNLQARRRRLKVSRAALARTLGVGSTTVYRHERGAMSALWDYALHGIEAEAKSRESKSRVRKEQVWVNSIAGGSDHMREHRRDRLHYTVEKMKGLKPQPPKMAKPVPDSGGPGGPRSRPRDEAWIKAAADRAEERSKKTRQL
jgi:DNA-binding XRE family transcriptional regulator